MKKTLTSLLLAAALVFTACSTTQPVSKGTSMGSYKVPTPDIIVGTNNVMIWQYRQLYLKGNAMSAFAIGDWYICRQITFSNAVVIADERFPNPNFPTQ